jgi:hypothetical protein
LLAGFARALPLANLGFELPDHAGQLRALERGAIVFCHEIGQRRLKGAPLPQYQVDEINRLGHKGRPKRPDRLIRSGADSTGLRAFTGEEVFCKQLLVSSRRPEGDGAVISARIPKIAAVTQISLILDTVERGPRMSLDFHLAEIGFADHRLAA